MASALGMPMSPVPDSTGSAPLHCGRSGGLWAIPLYYPTDSRRLEWQFSDPLSTHQNKVRLVTKESQGMDLAWGISPKFEELSDFVYFWHLSDIQVGRAQRPAPSSFRTSARRPLRFA